MAHRRSKSGPRNASFFLTLIASTFLMGFSFVTGKVLLQQGFSDEPRAPE
jgi:hypothetical protein